MTTTVAVLGAGAWGTAIAVHLSRRAGIAVQLWARDPAQAAAIAAARENVRYLPGVSVPASIEVNCDLAAAARADLLLAAVPVAALPALADALRTHGARAPLISLSKGFLSVPPSTAHPAGVALAHQVLAPRWPGAVGAVSGPSFADEVARGLPTAVAVAATDSATASAVATLLRGDALRAYETADLVGIEIGGAVKNVMAIAAGASDGLRCGDNARAALVTRGLAEMARLCVALGGQRETMMGLAGLGDLVLTCTGNQSRNRRVGLALAEGRDLASILAGLGHVAEGVAAARAVRALAAHHAIEMPICEALSRVLHEGLAPAAALQALLAREPRPEAH